MVRRAEMAWQSSLEERTQPLETRRGLPGDPNDSHSRYIEAAVGGMIVGCLPNGNPRRVPNLTIN
jgi:exodeoxyribonuclease-3